MDLEAHIASIDQQFMSTFSNLDAEGIAEFYSQNALLLPPNHPVVLGKKNIQKFWKQVFNIGIVEVTLQTVEFEEFGNSVALQYGKYGLYNATGVPLDEGKYLMVWKEVEKRWFIQKDMWNSDNAS